MLPPESEIDPSDWERRIALAALLDEVEIEALGLVPVVLKRVLNYAKLKQRELGVWAKSCAAEELGLDA